MNKRGFSRAIHIPRLALFRHDDMAFKAAIGTPYTRGPFPANKTSKESYWTRTFPKEPSGSQRKCCRSWNVFKFLGSCLPVKVDNLNELGSRFSKSNWALWSVRSFNRLNESLQNVTVMVLHIRWRVKSPLRHSKIAQIEHVLSTPVFEASQTPVRITSSPSIKSGLS